MGIKEKLAQAAGGRAAAATCAALAVLALAGGMAALAGTVQVERTIVVEAASPEEAPEQEPEEAATPEEMAEGLLPEAARDARAGYGKVEREILATLEANVWTAGRANLTLSFAEDGLTFTENDAGTASVTAFAIVAASASETATEDGVRQTTWRFTVQTPQGTDMATLRVRAYTDGSASVTTLTCPLFEHATSWTLAERAESVEVDGPEEDWYAANGTSVEALVAAFDEFVGTDWPTVSSARWSGTISFDYSAGTARLPFTLDDASGTRVWATLDLASGAFSVSEAR